MRSPKPPAKVKAPPKPSPEAINLIDAMDAPELFAPHFRGDSWTAWRAFLKALFAILMDDAELALYRRHTGRQAPPTAAFVEAALIVGRRGGKSRVLALIATYLATFRDYAPHLAPGEMATVAVIASDRKQARSIFRFIQGLLKAVPSLAALVAEETAEAITLTNNVQIEISTASFRSARGYTFAAVLADEIAFWRSDETSANPDVEILRAVRPGMASIPGSVLLLASSPYAKRGSLYQTYRRHYGKDDARVLAWKADTASMNPRIDPAIIAEAYEADPDAARAEYGAEFRDDLADFVTREVVDAVTMWGRDELPPMLGVVYAAFVDPSGGASDSMTMGIGHLEQRGEASIAVLDLIREVRAPFDPEATVMQFAAVLKTYGISTVTGDRYSGAWVPQRFSEHGITYQPSALPKSDLYLSLLPLLHAGRVELLDHARLGAQLVALERKTARSGRDSVDHTPGAKDDVANAAAGVLVGLDLDRRPGLIRADDMTVAGAGVPFPLWVDYVFSVFIVAEDGTTATAHFSYSKTIAPGTAPLILLDFDSQAGYSPKVLVEVSQKQAALAKEILHCPLAWIWAQTEVVEHFHHAGIPCVAMEDDHLIDPASLALAASGHIAAGKFKLSTRAAEKAQRHPLGGALTFRAGDRMDRNPLRLALLLGIKLCLSLQSAKYRPVAA